MTREPPVARIERRRTQLLGRLYRRYLDEALASGVSPAMAEESASVNCYGGCIQVSVTPDGPTYPDPSRPNGLTDEARAIWLEDPVYANLVAQVTQEEPDA